VRQGRNKYAAWEVAKVKIEIEGSHMKKDLTVFYAVDPIAFDFLERFRLFPRG